MTTPARPEAESPSGVLAILVVFMVEPAFEGLIPLFLDRVRRHTRGAYRIYASVNHLSERQRGLVEGAADSTGFGRGVAVPHVKHPGVTKMTAAVGRSSKGVDFSALDRQPVYSVVLLLSPGSSPEDHLKAMEVIFKSLGNETFRRFLRQATTQEDIIELLHEADHQKLPG